MNDQLKKVLNENGIAPAPKSGTCSDMQAPDPKKCFDEKFGGDPLADLFGYFGEIFGSRFEEDRQANYKKAEDEKKKNGKK